MMSVSTINDRYLYEKFGAVRPQADGWPCRFLSDSESSIDQLTDKALLTCKALLYYFIFALSYECMKKCCEFSKDWTGGHDGQIFTCPVYEDSKQQKEKTGINLGPTLN